MTDDVFGFHVPRVCRVRTVEATEDPILRTVDAFRSRDEEIIVDAERLQAGALALPSVVAASGAVVVLGEPGAGKTSVLVDLTSELPRVGDCWDGESDACLWVSGGDLTESSYVEELRCYLDALPLAGDSATGPTGVLTVVLDQADESSFLRRLPKQIVKALQSRDNTRVRFLMACRTADYPAPMTLALVEAFGTCRCVDLAPLTREEAEALADSAGVPGKILVEEAEAARATVLASIPLTLELLVLTYKSSGRLPDTPEEIFASGVHRLVEDPDLHRLNRAVVTTAQQRLAVAGRIAAWMLLSGHRTVWRGTAFGAGAFDLPGDALAGGREWTAAGSYEATPHVVEETLATALFTVPDDNRVVFRHSSVTAYLAARYLTDRGTTQRQFESIFLVGTPDNDSASIPAPLRETAAWLVAMNPTATDWLAAADPESLAVHSALVRSDEVRRLTVSRLLERAAQIELNDTRWQLSRWDLHHPGLADQLADVLETAPNDGAPDWKTTARIRLAIELAQEADVQHPRLAVALLRLAENNAWHQTERRLAASAAFACDAAYAVPVLARMLNSLDDPSFAVLSDPDHELRGTVLTLLWPEHLDLATMLAALRPPAPHVHNAYTQFLRNMPSRCANECLPDLLDWAKTAVLDPKAPTTGFVFSSDRIENSLIESVIDRTLRSPDTMQYIEILAKIVLRLFEGHDEVRIPDCLQPDEEGQEPVETQRLRRVFAQALVEETARLGRDPRQAAWMILQDWKFRSALRWDGAFIPESAIRNQLLDGTDFTWALAQAVESATCGDKSLVAAYGELAAYLFPRDDRQAVELAYDEEHPAWPYLKSSFEPIALDSSLAHALRQGRSTHNFNPEADEHLAELARLLSEARTGDNDSLYRFIWGLRFNPKTGQREDLTGRIRTWTCAAALNDELADLPELALRYLTDEHDHADSWLVHSTDDKRSWAGYALLAELYSENRLTELPPAVWHSWPAAILTEYLGTSTSFNETERKYLLRQAAVHAPEALARRITQLVSAALTKGRQPFELNAVDLTWTVELRTAVEGILTQLSACFGIIQGNENGGGLSAESGPEKQLSLADADDIREAAVRTWYSLLVSLLKAGSAPAAGLVDITLENHTGEATSGRLAVLAACALLTVDAETNWKRVKALVSTDRDLSRQLTEECVGSESTQIIQRTLDEAQLADLYLWLSALYIPEKDVFHLGVRRVTPDDEARRWRDGVLFELSRRGTREAVHELRRLASRNPDRLSVASALVAARKQYAAANWSQVQVDDVIRVLQDPARRVIRTSMDLLDVVQEILGEIQGDLPSHGELLWDRTPGKRRTKGSATTPEVEAIPDLWRPKPEAALCAYLTHELTLRLAGHRVAVNREVLVQPTDAYGAGDRTDILIDTLPPSGDGTAMASDTPVKLVIEVKGAWNPGIMTSLEDQLSDRYLPEAGTDAGIYLVGWYPIELWDATGDRRKTQAKKLTPGTLLKALGDQAASLSQVNAVSLRPVVLTVSRPHTE